MSNMILDATQLIKMSQSQLDELFRTSPAGDVPRGEGDGTAIIDPGTELADIAAKFVHIFAWKGKVFDPETGQLRNEISPLGIRAIVANVYKGKSWFDGEECIVLDYSQTSLVAHWIRDEIRMVAPGLYLGIVFWDKAKLLNFALAFPQ
ncbi:hypothetical protein KSF_067310 [Reticulibacter mediterranei]|uniref:Uncharacterized protein n=1 Tax=Reticulibacter mediterranei TaxID=2778369 RepID=A0A8J3N5N6_9CHLR|nr:hypothetical protein [Reticulibacter mediterranei]GHO96683.1 hypothetical protein KSF_067310 [Reticulibacter mediterranei]